MFITIEGSEGAGKSTNIEYIVDYLKNAGKELVITREPGGTKIGEQLRAMLLDPQFKNMDFRTELLLMFAARAQHIAEVIQPALNAGKWVICDRFTDVTYAYQGAGRQMGKENVAVLEQWVQGDLRPDLTFLLDVPVDIGMQRVGQRSEHDRFEQEKLQFFDVVRSAYREMADAHTNRFRVIDASQDLTSVQADLKKNLDDIL